MKEGKAMSAQTSTALFCVTHKWKHVSPTYEPRPPRSFSLLDDHTELTTSEGKETLWPTAADFNVLPPGSKTYNITFAPDEFVMTDAGTGDRIAKGYLNDRRSGYPVETYYQKESKIIRSYWFGMGSTATLFLDDTLEVVFKGSGIPVLSVLFGTLHYIM
jgi:hypothetical protein